MVETHWHQAYVSLIVDMEQAGIAESLRTMVNKNIMLKFKRRTGGDTSFTGYLDKRYRPTLQLNGILIDEIDNSEKYYYHADHNKNIIAQSNAAGEITATWDYDAFGNIIAQTGTTASKNPFRFSSEYHDENLGLIYYNYRHYNPRDGRWISRDPSAEKGGKNLYGFVGNSPLYATDKLGLWQIMGASKASKAIACAEKGDTWEGLANMTQLSPYDVQKWVTGYTSSVKPFTNYQVPNLIIQAWYGDVGWIGRRYSGWDFVSQGDHQIDSLFYSSSPYDATSNELGLYAMHFSKWKVLYGVYVYGHGNPSGVVWGKWGETEIVDGRKKRINPIIWNYRKTNLDYKLARVDFRVCQSKKAEKYCANNGGVCDVFEGTYVPLPIAWGVDIK